MMIIHWETLLVLLIDAHGHYQSLRSRDIDSSTAFFKDLPLS